MTHVLSAVAWPYANGPRHIGHVAGFGVPSDVFSRYMRMAGHDVLMVSGTDEHGTPILVAAERQLHEQRAADAGLEVGGVGHLPGLVVEQQEQQVLGDQEAHGMTLAQRSRPARPMGNRWCEVNRITP